jgi:L-aspartate semialdehyde sulfurtransferase ferredoxin
MVKRGVKFTFPPGLTKKPFIYKLGRQFEVVTNIRHANINGDERWVVLELEGEGEDIERGIAGVTDKWVRVHPAVGDIVEG